MKKTLKKLFTAIAVSALTAANTFIFADVTQMSPAESAAARNKMVSYSKQFIGCSYASGATGPDTFDCSGFVYSVASQSVGIQLPRMTKNMYTFVQIISDNQKEAGDLVFFKTTSSGEVSHVGIYIGNNQFIHCASDGPNNGVIVSSLNESYWKGKYYQSGRFISPTKEIEPEEEVIEVQPVKKAEAKKTPAKTASSSSNRSSSARKSSASPFMRNVVIDSTFAMDWNLCTPDYFRLVFRGLETMTNARYTKSVCEPGLGFGFKWDSGTGVVQIPLFASFTVSDNFRLYAGPVLSIGTPYIPGRDEDKDEISASVFPGILGVVWNTPPMKAGATEISFAQDIHYSVYNNKDGSALTPIKSVSSGLVFSSGVRVTFPRFR